jgi:hypothetical protein
MKIAINLVGISHLDNRSNQIDSRNRPGGNRYRPEHPPNIIEKIINILKLNHEVVTYITTYKHEKLDDLLEMYDCKKYTVIENFETSYMQDTYTKSLFNLKNDDNDFVISTRFDVVFKKDINEIALNYNKFNVLYRENNSSYCGNSIALNYTSDILFGFPVKFTEDVAQSIIELYASGEKNGLHGLAYHLSRKIGVENIHSCDLKYQLGFDNDYFYIPRLLYEPM